MKYDLLAQRLKHLEGGCRVTQLFARRGSETVREILDVEISPDRMFRQKWEVIEDADFSKPVAEGVREFEFPVCENCSNSFRVRAVRRGNEWNTEV